VVRGGRLRATWSGGTASGGVVGCAGGGGGRSRQALVLTGAGAWPRQRSVL